MNIKALGLHLLAFLIAHPILGTLVFVSPLRLWLLPILAWKLNWRKQWKALLALMLFFYGIFGLVLMITTLGNGNSIITTRKVTRPVAVSAPFKSPGEADQVMVKTSTGVKQMDAPESYDIVQRPATKQHPGGTYQGWLTTWEPTAASLKGLSQQDQRLARQLAKTNNDHCAELKMVKYVSLTGTDKE